MESKIVSLRTLTRKSLLWFGKYQGLSIQQIIDLRNQTYLRWLYYNYEGITFIEDILKQITIEGEREIQKPGKHPKCI